MKRLFIVGVGRSGTSLLQSMIGANSNVSMSPETGFIRRYLISSIFNRANIKVSSEELNNDTHLKRLNIDFKEYGEVIDVYPFFQELSKTSGFRYLGEKDPKLIESLSALNELFPDCRVLHIYRDPRDVYLSKKKASWSSEQSVFRKLLASSAQIKLLNRFKNSTNKSEIFEIKYEDLISNPKKVLNSVCHYLQVGFEDKMLDFQDVSKLLVAKDELSWKKETFGPLLSSNSRKWVNELSDEEVYLVQLCNREIFKLGKYEFSNVKLPFFKRIILRAKWIAIEILSSFYALLYSSTVKGVNKR